MPKCTLAVCVCVCRSQPFLLSCPVRRRGKGSPQAPRTHSIPMPTHASVIPPSRPSIHTHTHTDRYPHRTVPPIPSHQSKPPHQRLRRLTPEPPDPPDPLLSCSCLIRLPELEPGSSCLISLPPSAAAKSAASVRSSSATPGSRVPLPSLRLRTRGPSCCSCGCRSLSQPSSHSSSMLPSSLS